MLKQVIDGFSLSIFTAFVILVVLVLPTFWFGPAFETKHFPVVVDYLATPEFENDPNYAWYTISFNKVRDCEPLNIFAWYVVDAQGRQTRVAIRPGNPSPIYRPFGKNLIPNYRVDSLRRVPYTSQKLIMAHRCHPFWVTRTVIDIPIGSNIYDNR